MSLRPTREDEGWMSEASVSSKADEEGAAAAPGAADDTPRREPKLPRSGS